MSNAETGAVRILGELSDLLARYGYEERSEFVADVTTPTDSEAFWSAVGGLEFWGGSGAVREVEPFRYSHPESDRSEDDYRRFQVLMVELSDILEAKGLGNLSARSADLFRRRLEGA